MVLGWVLFLSVVALCVLIVVRAIRKDPSPFPYGGDAFALGVPGTGFSA